jgi:hypothetical protein
MVWTKIAIQEISLNIQNFLLSLKYETQLKIFQIKFAYFSIDNARVIYTKSINSLKMNTRGIHSKGVRGKSNVR